MYGLTEIQLINDDAAWIERFGRCCKKTSMNPRNALQHMNKSFEYRCWKEVVTGQEQYAADALDSMFNNPNHPRRVGSTTESGYVIKWTNRKP